LEPLTPPQQRLYTRTGELLRESFEDGVLALEEEPAYYVRLGRIGVRINVEPVGESDAVLETYSWVAQELETTSELGRYLAERNVQLRFGSLCIDGEGAILLQHALFAEATNEVVLTRLVRIMAESADALDQELRDRFA
jgi:hypothetical protein